MIPSWCQSVCNTAERCFYYIEGREFMKIVIYWIIAFLFLYDILSICEHKKGVGKKRHINLV